MSYSICLSVQLAAIAAVLTVYPSAAPASAYGSLHHYRPACTTVYQMQPVTVYHVQCETVYEEARIVRYHPVWETQVQQRRYFVARPVTQTVMREEKCTVRRPVWETRMHDASYNQVRNIVETHEREETYTVSRPVWETQMQSRRSVVRRYQTQTVSRQVQQVGYQPVTTYATKYEDRGRYEVQQAQVEQQKAWRLRWVPGGWIDDPATDRQRYSKGGLTWIPNRVQTQTVSRRVWQPNPVAVQVPKTTYQRVVSTQTVPTQVGGWVNQEVVQNVPVRVKKMVAETRTRKVPYSTTRQVVERVERQIPVRVCNWVCEEQVRQVPQTYTRLMYEERLEQVPVCVCKMVAVEETVQIPRTVERMVPLTCQRCLPQTMIVQLPCNSCDPCLAGSAAVAADAVASSEIVVEPMPMDLSPVAPNPPTAAPNPHHETPPKRPSIGPAETTPPGRGERYADRYST